MGPVVRRSALRAYWCAGASATLYGATILAKRGFSPYEWPAGACHVVSTSLKRPSRRSYYLSLLKTLFAITIILADQPSWWVRPEVRKMETAIIRIFEQHLDFVSADAAMQLAQRFTDQFENIYTRLSHEDVPPEELSKAHRFLFEEIKQLVRRDPRLDLRYPDEAISNVALMLVDDLVRVVAPQSNDALKRLAQ